MDSNTFLFSDASYDPKSKTAAIAVMDYCSNEAYTRAIEAKDIQDAEESALLDAILLAIQKGYENCVFVYDALTLDTARQYAYFNGFFKHMQFLWLKREYLQEVDFLARAKRKSIAMGSSKRVAAELISWCPILQGAGDDLLLELFGETATLNVQKQLITSIQHQETLPWGPKSTLSIGALALLNVLYHLLHSPVLKQLYLENGMKLIDAGQALCIERGYKPRYYRAHLPHLNQMLEKALQSIAPF